MAAITANTPNQHKATISSSIVGFINPPVPNGYGQMKGPMRGRGAIVRIAAALTSECFPSQSRCLREAILRLVGETARPAAGLAHRGTGPWGDGALVRPLT